MEPAKNEPSVNAVAQTDGEAKGNQRPADRSVARRKRGRQEYAAEILEFQPDVVEIEHSLVDGRIRWTLYVVVTLIVAAVVWACVAEVDRIVVTNGRLVPTSPHIVVQPLKTGRIRDIHVRVGQVAEAGAKLVTLDSTFTAADVNRLTGQLTRLRAKKRRLEAECNNGAFKLPPGETSEAWGDQLVLYTARQAQYDAQLQSHDQQIAHLTASLDTNQKDQKTCIHRLAVLSQLEANARSRGERLESQHLLRMAEAEYASLVLKRKELEPQLQQVESDRRAFVEKWRHESADALAAVNSEYDALAEELKKVQELDKSVVLASPEKAVVLELAKLSIGSVVKEAEPLITLVPVGEDLEAEVEIDSKDIGRLRTGQTVRVKLEAFPFQKHGTLTGVVTTITEDAFQTDEDGIQNTVYLARVALTSSVRDMRNMPEDFGLLPGMRVVGEIGIGKRRVISYFVYPVLRFLDESVREP